MKQQLTECGNDNNKTIRIYSIVFAKRALCLSTDDREDFWLEIAPGVGWVKFEKLRPEKDFTEHGALFVAKELRSGSASTPDSIVQARCVLWRLREALSSAAGMCSFLLGQKYSDE